MIDINSWTMAELHTIEKLSGQSITALSDNTAPRGLLLAALGMVAKRRDGHPEFSWNDAQAMTMTDVTDLLGINSDDDAEAPEAS